MLKNNLPILKSTLSGMAGDAWTKESRINENLKKGIKNPWDS
jgi:hypothetical protein